MMKIYRIEHRTNDGRVIRGEQVSINTPEAFNRDGPETMLLLHALSMAWQPAEGDAIVIHWRYADQADWYYADGCDF